MKAELISFRITCQTVADTRCQGIVGSLETSPLVEMPSLASRRAVSSGSSAVTTDVERRRWLESQLLHLKLFFSRKEHVPRKTKDYWNKLFINLIPPRIIFVGVFFIIFLCCLVQYFVEIDITGFAIAWWILLFAAYILSMIFAVPSHLVTFSTFKAFLYLPSVFFSYVRAALTMKINRKEFVHTPKSYTGKTESTEK